MPKIEQYQGPQARTEVIKGPRATELPIGAFGAAQLAPALADVGKAFGEVQTRIDKTTAEDALVSFEREKNELFFNPESGYFNLQGKDAYDNSASARKSITDLKSKYSEQLKSQSAREMFDRVAAQHVLSADTDVMKHATKGYQAWETATAKASVENTIENASLYWNDPAKLGVQRELGRQTVLDVADREGITGTALAERLQTYDSSFAGASVEAALVSSSVEADDAMAKYGDLLEGPMKQKLQVAIDKKKKAEKTQLDSQMSVLHANKLIDQYGDDRGAILDALRDIKDPEMQQKARKEAMYQLTQMDKVKSKQQLDAYNAAYDYTSSQGSVEAFKAASPEQWELLTPTQKKSIEKGEGESHDWNKWYETSLMSTGDMKKLDADQVSNIASNFDKSHRDKFISMVRSARGEGSSADKMGSQVGRTTAGQTKSAVEQLIGKNSGKWGKEDKSRADQFYQLIDTESTRLTDIKGRPLDSNEYSSMLNSLTREVSINKSVLGIKYEVTRELSSIPKEDLSILTNYLRKNNIPVTSESLINAYQQANQ